MRNTARIWIKGGIFPLLIVLATVLLLGCSGSGSSEAQGAAEAGLTEAGFSATSKNVKVDRVQENNVWGNNESHEIMAAMILKGAGMNEDLESYNSVSLVSHTAADGTNIKAVLLNNKDLVIPEAAK
jgi:hypothetical protein